MRLKCYTASSMAEAMAMVRQELGDDAIIVSTQRATGEQGVRITAAVEEPQATEDDIHQAILGQATSPTVEVIRDCLAYHGVPERLLDKLAAAAHSVGVDDPTMACAGALDQLFVYAPLPEKQSPTPFMLVGPPGSGKTISVAKLAARARIAGRSVGVISADSVRAGAIEQIAAFTSILSIDLRRARGPQSLREEIESLRPVCDLIFIDTPGLNPFNPDDMQFLKGLISVTEVEPVLVLAAGGDAAESAEIGQAFALVGATRLLATRLDMTRRLGAVLAAADAGQFMFCEVSINPHVADGLCPITPVSMARLLVPPAEELPDVTDSSTASSQATQSPDVGDSGVGSDFTDGDEGDEDVSSIPTGDPDPRPFFSGLRRIDTADAKSLKEVRR